MPVSGKSLQELLVRHEIKTTDCWSQIGDGWIPLVNKLFTDLIALGWDRDLIQVKEKFGSLRVYIGDSTEKMHKLISKAEEDSFKTCEDCGTQDNVTTNGAGYIVTLCDTCRKKDD